MPLAQTCELRIVLFFRKTHKTRFSGIISRTTLPTFAHAF